MTPTRLSTNPRLFPDDVQPRYILKAKNGNIHFLMSEPSEARLYVWYMAQPRLVSWEQLAQEMAQPQRRWYATDRAAYELQCRVGACGDGDGEAYVCLRHATKHDAYWFGRRVAPPPPRPPVLILTVAELYLKSELHQKQLIRVLLEHLRRVLDNPHVFRNGRSMIEVRDRAPTAAQMELLMLLPGIGKVYEARGDDGDGADTNGDDKAMLECKNDSDGDDSILGNDNKASASQRAAAAAAARRRVGGDLRGKLLGSGAGGIPILPTQPVLVLLSGGIDSPVAAYRMMTRGCTVRCIHFLNSTSSTAAVVDKNRRICERLSRVQGRLEMSYVDMSTLQAQIVAHVANHNRTLLYKWFMLALAAAFDEARLLVTGDSLGQVASQTYDNISTLYATLAKAVVAPLMGTHKTSIMDEARRLGTYEYSIQEGADCCQYMMCKTGANLHIGPRALAACVRQIGAVPTLPVTREVYCDGALSATTTYSYQPRIAVRGACVDATTHAAATRMHNRHAHTQRDDDAAHACVATTTTTTPSSAATATAAAAHADDAPRVYFDAAAGTHMAASVREAMAAAPEANANSMHTSGRLARMAVERVRSELAHALRVPARDLIFTSGGTESNNIALHGYRVEREAWSHASTAGPPLSPKAAGEAGVAPVRHDRRGNDDDDDNDDVVDEKKTTTTEDDARVVVRVVDLVNHETGSVSRDLRRPCGRAGRLHVDASQALCKLDWSSLDLSEVDSMTVTAHKINGPVGVGALYLRNRECHRMYSGGHQEHGIRPGTENVAAIVGFGAALQLDRSASVHWRIDDLLVAALGELGCEVNRRGETSGYIVHATLPPGYRNTDVVSLLSTRYRVEIGTGSACHTGTANTTVYDTLGKTPAPDRAIRISWDDFATLDDAKMVVAALQSALRDLAPRRRS